ncbi:MAG: cell division protein FtsL [Gammaproteobacteria bacterium]|nr:cell division protein FtsL [Gammaproteobacteria bacterium]
MAEHDGLSRSAWLGLVLLWAGTISSALGVVYARHESRKAFINLQALYDERDELDIDWDRLLIEQSTWATHARIEQMARQRLKMRVPDPAEIVILRP